MEPAIAGSNDITEKPGFARGLGWVQVPYMPWSFSAYSEIKEAGELEGRDCVPARREGVVTASCLPLCPRAASAGGCFRNILLPLVHWVIYSMRKPPGIRFSEIFWTLFVFILYHVERCYHWYQTMLDIIIFICAGLAGVMLLIVLMWGMQNSYYSA